MGAPYTSQSASGYNTNPPSDDGSQTEANRVKWATIKTKLNDPVKALADSINSAVSAAFGKIIGGAGITSTSISYQALATDQGKLVRASAGGITITTPSAADVSEPFVFAILNDGTSDITVDGSGAETIDGSVTVTVPPDAGLILYTDGTNWFTTGQNYQRTQVFPQGYLTTVPTATDAINPLPASDQSAKTAIYYRPDKGNLVPISTDGTKFITREFAELTLTLAASHAANAIYDVFAFDDGGTIRIGTGPAWTTATAGSGARGTGAGTTELTRLKGLLVNTVSMTVRNGSSTYTVAASCGTYLGSILMDGTNGQVSCLVAFGQARKWGVWNAYNRRSVRLLAGDATASWTYASTFRASNNDTNNKLALFFGLADENARLRFHQNVSTGGGPLNAQIGIGLNSQTVASGLSGYTTLSSSNGIVQAIFDETPKIGLNEYFCIERRESGSNNVIFIGGSGNMQLAAEFMA